MAEYKKQSKEFFDKLRRELEEKQKQKKERAGKTLEERLNMLPQKQEEENEGFRYFSN